jgi:hypothetical protein
MENRALNPKALATMAAAVALTLALSAGIGQAQGRSASHLAPSLPMRTLMAYDDGAWTSPVAVVLNSPAAWTAWNHEMVARGMAIGEEPVPAGVDWSKEAVLVVALGGGSVPASRVRLENAHRVGLTTEVVVQPSTDGVGEYPCHVVAMSRQLLKHVQIANAAQCGLAEQVAVYAASPAVAAANSGTPTAIAVSWGEVKDAYRE